MSDSFSITRCTAEQRPAALRLLHDNLPTDQQNGLVQALKACQTEGENAFDGLLVVHSTSSDTGNKASNEILAATWAQLLTGRTAVVWLPNHDNSATRSLLTAIAHFLDENAVDLAQFLAAPGEPINTELLAVAGFQKLAELAYLTVDCQQPKTPQPATSLSFIPNAAEPNTNNPNTNNKEQQLGELLLRTYVDSQDCPELNGVRDLADVLNGYRDQGVYTPERWFFVQHKGQDVGALILTAYADTGNWELVYMGLVPEARGHGWGQQILDFARWQAGQGGAERLVLAVDEANSFAFSMYQHAGFVTWDRRTVYARLRT